jgi:hypothetical protein
MIFNIKDNESSQILKAEWDTGNNRENVQFGYGNTSIKTQLCNNFYANNSDPCDVPLASDRISFHSKIKSSTKSARPNNNNVPIYFNKNIGTNAMVANFLFSYAFKIHLPKPFQRINN